MSGDFFGPNDPTLVKYENPILVSDESNQKRNIMRPMTDRPTSPGFPETPNIPGLCGPTIASQDSGLSKKEMEDILNSILPPREWEEMGKVWRQVVSSVPGTRIDVMSLQEQLLMRLVQRQARAAGICPIRRELYSQVFEELIRQVTINNAERGLLLLRVRDEIRMTLAAYQSLYESSTAYGARKAILTEYGFDESQTKLEDLIIDRDAAQLEIQELRIKIEQLERKQAEIKEVTEKKRAEDIQFLKRANQQLKAQLDGILGTKKAA